jgi:hypothetical protein
MTVMKRTKTSVFGEFETGIEKQVFEIMHVLQPYPSGAT